jgi:hypothetical protein
VGGKKGRHDFFYNEEQRHLPSADWPPNNIRSKKVYRQTLLYINKGGTRGKECAFHFPSGLERRHWQTFPSPTFMGFRAKLSLGDDDSTTSFRSVNYWGF